MRVAAEAKEREARPAAAAAAAEEAVARAASPAAAARVCVRASVSARPAGMSSSSSSSSAAASSSSGGSALVPAPAPASSCSSSAPAAKRARDGEGNSNGDDSGGGGGAVGAAPAPLPAPAPFRGPAADSRLGELLLDVLPLACAVGFGLDLHHARHVCGLTLREGVRRADGSLDRAGFLGGAADMIKCAARIQAPWLAAARAKGREGSPPTQLIRAANAGDEQRVRELVAAGAPLDLVDYNGRSALRWASRCCHARVVKQLLDGKYEGKGADTNQQDIDGWTPLIKACTEGHEAVVRLLLERGANASLRDRYGRTALYWSRLREHAAIVALLEARGAPE